MNKQDIADKAAGWWAKQLRGTKFDAFDAGDEQNSPGDMSWLLATFSAAKSRTSVSSEKVESFKKNLSDKILSLLSEKDKTILSVDYGPDAYLDEVLRSVDLPSNLLPRKTVMWISEKWVSVKFWYNWEVQEL